MFDPPTLGVEMGMGKDGLSTSLMNLFDDFLGGILHSGDVATASIFEIQGEGLWDARDIFFLDHESCNVGPTNGSCMSKGGELLFGYGHLFLG